MQLINGDDGSRLSWFEPNGVGSFYKLSGDVADKLRGTRGKGASISNTDIIGETFLTYQQQGT
ncbi:MAG: hypothetical protein EOO38_13760 [Cytophagaceae bacterium]|nr:MAG: hypothetical protein EOO38_13760 [Cytophagaceae bacterium]